MPIPLLMNFFSDKWGTPPQVVRRYVWELQKLGYISILKYRAIWIDENRKDKYRELEAILHSQRTLDTMLKS